MSEKCVYIYLELHKVGRIRPLVDSFGLLLNKDFFHVQQILHSDEDKYGDSYLGEMVKQ